MLRASGKGSWTSFALSLLFLAVALIAVAFLDQVRSIRQHFLRVLPAGLGHEIQPDLALTIIPPAADWSCSSSCSMLKKAFSGTLPGAHVEPFFRRKIRSFSSQDLTLTTWITVDRLRRLEKLSCSFDGPISCALYVSPGTRGSAQVAIVHNRWAQNPCLSRNVDLHLVTASRMLRHNVWRNVARTFVGTDWVMMLDADFDICGDLQASLEDFRSGARSGQHDRWAKDLEGGRLALVVPAFEYVGADPLGDLCPEDKTALYDLYDDLHVEMFWVNNPRLQHHTNYTRYFLSDEDYQVDDFDWGYEPYLIYRNNVSTWCDERFQGNAWDKSACVGEMYLSGMDLVVLADQYIFHEAHPRVEPGVAAVSGELSDNDLAWRTFRMDKCSRIAESLAEAGQLHLVAGNRVRYLCEGVDQELDEALRGMVTRSSWVAAQGMGVTDK